MAFFSLRQKYLVIYQEKKGFIDAKDLLRASEITQVELSEEEIAGMLITERN